MSHHVLPGAPYDPIGLRRGHYNGTVHHPAVRQAPPAPSAVKRRSVHQHLSTVPTGRQPPRLRDARSTASVVRLLIPAATGSVGIHYMQGEVFPQRTFCARHQAVMESPRTLMQTIRHDPLAPTGSAKPDRGHRTASTHKASRSTDLPTDTSPTPGTVRNTTPPPRRVGSISPGGWAISSINRSLCRLRHNGKFWVAFHRRAPRPSASGWLLTRCLTPDTENSPSCGRNRPKRTGSWLPVAPA